MFRRFYFLLSLVLVIAVTTASEETAEHIQYRNKRKTLPAPKTCPPLTSFKMNVTCFMFYGEYPCNTDLIHGTIARPKCERFYKPSFKPTYSELICLINGTWNNPIFDCVPECGLSSLESNLFRITDGIDANTGTFPWHAGLYYRQNNSGAVAWIQRCSGTLITDRLVITVAHCVADTKEENLRVALGKYYRDWDRTVEGEVKRTVSKIIYQRDFSKSIYTFDLALLQLSDTIEFSKTIMPVCHGFLADSTDLNNKDLYVAGWGLTKEEDRNSASHTLVYKSVVLTSEDICKKNAPSIYPTFDKFCTVKGNNTRVSTIQSGDSGGGITTVYDGLHVILGAVSAKKEQYSIFTNFTWPYNAIWIENQIKKFDSSFRWDEATQFQNNERGCLLPEASKRRKFCFLTDGCKSCDVHEHSCIIPPNLKVDRVRVVCARGYTVRSPHSGGDVSICINGQWYPELPDCYTYEYYPGIPFNKVTWEEARESCMRKGHILATIKNKEEQERFLEAILTYYVIAGLAKIHLSQGNVWIGLSDLTNEGTFEWTDGTMLGKNDFTKLARLEKTTSDEIEDCVMLIPKCADAEHCYEWKQDYCSELNHYFCKLINVPESIISDWKKEHFYTRKNVVATDRYRYLPGNPWTKVTWDEARDNCVAMGSQLAIIRDSDQNIRFQNSVDKQFNVTGTTPSSVWIGLRAYKFGEKQLFNWTDGSYYNASRDSWSNWMHVMDGYNSVKNQSNPNKDCTEAVATDKKSSNTTIYKWNEKKCTDVNYYFCSFKL